MEVYQTRDLCVDKLTSTTGVDLEIMSNITSGAQIAAVMEGYIAQTLSSRYGMARYEMLLRLTVSHNARGRDDLRGIGTTPDIQGWQQDGGDSEI